MTNFLFKYTEIFPLDGKFLTYTDVIKHSINTGDTAPIHVKSYRFPEVYKNEVKKKTNKENA